MHFVRLNNKKDLVRERANNVKWLFKKKRKGNNKVKKKRWKIANEFSVHSKREIENVKIKRNLIIINNN